MSNRATLEALLARVLEGTGPDRELDRCIHEVIGFCTHRKSTRYVRQSDSGFTCDDCGVELYGKREWPSYTASLDAALTLVPEGWHWSVSGTVNMEYHARIAPPTGRLKTFLGHWCEAKSAPRALIAACLKARMEAQLLSNP